MTINEDAKTWTIGSDKSFIEEQLESTCQQRKLQRKPNKLWNVNNKTDQREFERLVGNVLKELDKEMNEV